MRSLLALLSTRTTMTVQYTDPFGPAWRFQWLQLIFTWHGSIFQSFWLELFIAVATSAVALSIVYVTTRDREVGNWPDGLEHLAEVVAFIGRRFQAALAMMLGFYTSTMYGRWTAVRNKEGEALRKINDIALRIAWKVKEGHARSMEQNGSKDKDTNDEGHQRLSNGSVHVNVSHDENASKDKDTNNESQQRLSSRSVRTNLVRLINLAHAIVVGDLFEKRDNQFSSLEKLLDYGFATKKEYEFLKAQKTDCRFHAPLVWFQETISGLVENEFVGPIIDIRAALADLYMFRNEPVPLIYRQMVNVAVRLYMIMLFLDAIL